MADLRMKLNTNNEIKVKMKANDSISMKFDDYQKFKEEDPIFKDSPAYTITYNDINAWNNKSDFSGNYNDLTHKPNLSQYATITYVTSGLSDKVDKETGMGLSQNSFTTEEKNKLASLENYDDTAIINELNNKADISDVPTLTSELDNDSGFITKNVDDLTYYPTNDSVNSIVALKQNIIDSENMLSADYVDDTNTTNKFVTATDITNWNNKSDFSGDYNDLTNKPTIPTLTSQLTNDSGFLTSANIPTKTSDLQNDSGFITNAVNDLTNYTLSSALATVATSGSYNDLSNKPTIPTKTSDLTNDSGFVTNTYTSSETVCGKYLGKPLYRKVITQTVNANTNVGYSLSSLGITNTDIVIVNVGASTAHYAISTTGGGYAPIVYYVSNADRAHVYVNGNKELQIQNQNGNQREYNIVLEYTKTTD